MPLNAYPVLFERLFSHGYVCQSDVQEASLFMSTLQMTEIHLIQVLFLQCLKLFTQNAFDSWVDAVIGIHATAVFCAHD